MDSGEIFREKQVKKLNDKYELFIARQIEYKAKLQAVEIELAYVEEELIDLGVLKEDSDDA